MTRRKPFSSLTGRSTLDFTSCTYNCDHLGARARSAVAHPHRHLNLLAGSRLGRRNLQTAVIELRVGEPVPEREQRLDVALVEPPIADIDAFRVRDVQILAGIVRRTPANRTTAWGTSRAACRTGFARRTGRRRWRAPLPGPPYQASTTAGTRPIHLVMVTGRSRDNHHDGVLVGRRRPPRSARPGRPADPSMLRSKPSDSSLGA